MEDDIHDTTDRQQPHRRRLRWPYIIAVLVIAPLALMLIWRLATADRLQRMCRAIRTQGYPVTCEQLDAWYSIPADAANGADIVTGAIHMCVLCDPCEADYLPFVGRTERPERTEPLDENTLRLARQHLAANRETLALLDRVVEFDRFRYPIDLSNGYRTRIGPLRAAREVVMLLALKATVETELGDTDSFVKSVRESLAVGESEVFGPGIMSCNFSRAAKSIAVKLIERALNRTTVTADQLSELHSMLAETEDPNEMIRAIVAERCLFLHSAVGPGSDSFASYGSFGVSFKLYETAGMAERDAITYLEITDRLLEIAKLDHHLRYPHIEAVDKQLNDLSQLHFLLQMFAKAPYGICSPDSVIAARIRTATAALAIQRSRLETGELPDSPAQLVPEFLEKVPLDPYDGRPLRYRKLETGGFVVYSIGPDRIDNQGLEKPGGARSEDPHDITFIVER